MENNTLVVGSVDAMILNGCSIPNGSIVSRPWTPKKVHSSLNFFSHQLQYGVPARVNISAGLLQESDILPSRGMLMTGLE